MKRRSESQARSVLRERLEARREEIVAAALTRAIGIADPGDAADFANSEGLRPAVDAALDFALEALEGAENDPPVPVALLAQTRLAARNGVGLDTVLRRYFAGYSLLGYCLLEEASSDELMDGADLQRLLGAHAGNFDRLIAAVGEEHRREREELSATSGARRLQQLRRLLNGEAVDASQFDYELGGHHLGLLATGPNAEETIRRLATSLDLRLLLARPSQATVWAWLGSHSSIPHQRIDGLLASIGRSGPSQIALALGEPAEGLSGWRLSHRQAAAALPFAERFLGRITRYRNVALLAAAHRDDLLSTSLQMLYLEPLEQRRDGGGTARRVLRAYFGAERNVTSTAAVLGISRNTVARQLRAVEESIGQSLSTCGGELEVAVRLDDLTEHDSPRPLASLRRLHS